MQPPGIEPGSSDRESGILPLDDGCDLRRRGEAASPVAGTAGDAGHPGDAGVAPTGMQPAGVEPAFLE